MEPLTLLITTCDRAALLRTSLARLATLTVPDEVLVIDDGGTDDTEQVCRDFESQLPIRYVHHDNPGPSICSFARNVGTRLARNRLILTSEPEVVFLSDVVAQLPALREQDHDRVISAGTLYFADSRSSRWEDARALAGYRKEVGWVATYTALYVKDWLCEVGGWDENFPGAWGWDDTDLLTRLRIAGYGQRIATELEVAHQWHPLGADPDSANERYFFSKSFHASDDRDEVVANKDTEWGALRTKIS